MTAFIYVGGKESPDETIVFGHKFERRGDPVNVTDPHAIKKLSGNKEFQEVIDGKCEEVADDEKGVLIAQLESLGVKADRRKSVDSLKAMIAEAQDADGG